MGVGECAGEVVSQAEFALAASERELFEAQLLLDAGHSQPAAKVAYGSMVRAAQGLVKDQNPNVSDNENQVVTEFTRRFYDTQLFWDKYAGGKFAEYLFKAREFIASGRLPDADRAVQLLQEAQLFIDAAHDYSGGCGDRLYDGFCRAGCAVCSAPPDGQNARAEFLIADRSHVACRSFRRAHSKRLHLLCYGIFCVRRDAQFGAAKKIGAGFVARSIRGGYSPTDLIGQINAVRLNLSS